MANPNKTTLRWRERKLACIDEHVFNTRAEAENHLKDKEGDRKVVRSFKTGSRRDPTIKYVARVYVK
jgi:hypothetical protein